VKEYKKYDVPGILASLNKIESEARKLYNSIPGGEDENGYAITAVHKTLVLISNRATECRVLFSQLDAIDYNKPAYRHIKEVPEEQRRDFMADIIFTAFKMKFEIILGRLKSASMDSGKIINSKSLDDAIDDYMQFETE
jgi:hypothetical protein